GDGADQLFRLPRWVAQVGDKWRPVLGEPSLPAGFEVLRAPHLDRHAAKCDRPILVLVAAAEQAPLSLFRSAEPSDQRVRPARRWGGRPPGARFDAERVVLDPGAEDAEPGPSIALPRLQVDTH